jgi:hypothetical protein
MNKLEQFSFEEITSEGVGRLWNTLAKYIEITGSSHPCFCLDKYRWLNTPSTSSKHRPSAATTTPPLHIYSDVDGLTNGTLPQSNRKIIVWWLHVQSIDCKMTVSCTIVRLQSLGLSQTTSTKTSIYHNASNFHDDNNNDDNNDDDDEVKERSCTTPLNRNLSTSKAAPTNQSETFLSNHHQPSPEMYDRPKSDDNIAMMSSPVDRNNNHVVSSSSSHRTWSESNQRWHTVSDVCSFWYRRSLQWLFLVVCNLIHPWTIRTVYLAQNQNHRLAIDLPSMPSSPENTVFCIRSSDLSSTHQQTSRRRPDPMPRRCVNQTTPTDYVNQLAHLFTKNFSTVPSTIVSAVRHATAHEQEMATQTYDTASISPRYPTTENQISIISTHVSFPSKEIVSIDRIQIILSISSSIWQSTETSLPYSDDHRTINKIDRHNIRTISKSNSSSVTFCGTTLKSLLSKERFDDDDDDELEETPYSHGYDNLTTNDGMKKFPFVVPFNHSPTSAFIASMSTKKKMINNSSSSTIRFYSNPQTMFTSLKSYPNQSTSRSTLMTAV